MTTTAPSRNILRFDLFLKQGCDVTLTFTVVTATGDPITNPVGWTTRAQIRPTPTGPVMFEWNTTPTTDQGAAALTFTSGTNTSTLSLALTRAQSLLFPVGDGVWDCYLTSPAGQTGCVAEGAVSVTPAVTH